MNLKSLFTFIIFIVFSITSSFAQCNWEVDIFPVNDFTPDLLHEVPCTQDFFITFSGDLPVSIDFLRVAINLSGNAAIVNASFADFQGFYANNGFNINYTGNNVTIVYGGGNGPLNGVGFPEFVAIITVETDQPDSYSFSSGIQRTFSFSTSPPLCSSNNESLPYLEMYISQGETVSGLITSFSASSSGCDDTENLGIEGAEVSITGANGSDCEAISASDGVYSCELCEGGPYEICVETICPEPCGLSELDFVLLMDLLTGGIDNPTITQYITGDINQNGITSAIDLFEIRKAILGLETSIDNWCRFMPLSDYEEFADMGLENIPGGQLNDSDNCIDYDPSDPLTNSTDFIRFMLGDMNGSCSDCIHGDEMGDIPIVSENNGNQFKVRLTENENIYAYTINLDLFESTQILSVESALYDSDFAVIDNVLKIIAIPSDTQGKGIELEANEDLVIIEYSGEVRGLSLENNYISGKQMGRKVMKTMNVENLTLPKTELTVNALHKFNLKGFCQNVNIVLYDVMGQIYSTNKIDISTFKEVTIESPTKAGMYLLRVYNEENDITKKVFLTNQP